MLIAAFQYPLLGFQRLFLGEWERERFFLGERKTERLFLGEREIERLLQVQFTNRD